MSLCLSKNDKKEKKDRRGGWAAWYAVRSKESKRTDVLDSTMFKKLRLGASRTVPGFPGRPSASPGLYYMLLAKG